MLRKVAVGAAAAAFAVGIVAAPSLGLTTHHPASKSVHRSMQPESGEPNSALADMDTTTSSTSTALGAKTGEDEATSTTTAGLSSHDIAFMEMAAEQDLFQIAAGTFASSNATTPEVKALGARVASDDTSALQALRVLATDLGVNLPTAVSGERHGEMQDLTDKSGVDFDRAYAALEVRVLQHSTSQFKEEASDGTDAQVRDFATASLPMLDQQLTLARQAMAAVAQNGDFDDAHQPSSSEGSEGSEPSKTSGDREDGHSTTTVAGHENDTTSSTSSTTVSSTTSTTSSTTTTG